MKIIKTITDFDIIGKSGLSQALPRVTVRAILKNKDGKYALIHTDGFGIYAFVGGGVEDGESLVTALKREVFEETGCTCDKIVDLGCVIENRNYCDYVQHNYYFFVTTESTNIHPSFTSDEIRHNASRIGIRLTK